MISRYEIRKINNEEILYIYLDFNYEFAKIFSKRKNERLEDKVLRFIKENNIVFAGTTVAIILSGILIGHIFLDYSVVSNKLLESNYQVEQIVNENNIEYNTIKDKTNIESSSEEKIKDSNEADSSDNITNIDLEKTVSNESSKSVEEQSTKDIISNKVLIPLKKTNGEILNIELEEYIIGVVSAEMPATFHEQALMAQAVIARTYALKAISKGQILTDSVKTQSYINNVELRNSWGDNFNFYYNKVRNAVLNTEGLYLTYNGTYIEAVYHSTSNGTTEDSINVWGNAFPYLVSVESPYDTLNPSFDMEQFISYQEVSSKLTIEVNQNTNFNLIDITSSGRVKNIEVGGVVFKGVEFREKLGLRSTDFSISKTDNGINVKTRGYGHGVGMSQYGANGMAKNGYSYEQILTHYYRGVSINHI